MKLGILSIILLLVLAFVAAVTVFTPEEEGPDPVSISENAIVHYKNKLMYADVVSEYKNLIKLIDDDKDYDKIQEMYEYIITLKNYESDETLLEGANWARQMAVSRNPANTKLATEYMDYLCEKGNRAVYTYVNDLINYTAHPSHGGALDEEYQYYYSYYMNIKGAHTSRRLDYVQMSGWYEDHSLAVDANGLYYVIDTSGRDVVSELDTPILSYSSGDNLVAIEHEGQLVYTNPAEQRKRVPYIESDEKLLYYTYLGPFSDGLANFCDDKGEWGYLYTDMGVYASGLQGATPVQQGVFAVKNGGKWTAYYIAGGAVSLIADFSFPEIYQDEFGCSFGGFTSSTDAENVTTVNAVFYARDDAASAWKPYRLVLTGGDDPVYRCEELGKDTYSEVKLFGDTAGAVKTANGWGFIGTDGKLIEMGGKYFEDAASFVCGVAPASLLGEWGYINELGDFVISPQYESATVMSSDGSGIVWGGDDVYYMLMLNEYER